MILIGKMIFNGERVEHETAPTIYPHDDDTVWVFDDLPHDAILWTEIIVHRELHTEWAYRLPKGTWTRGGGRIECHVPAEDAWVHKELGL